MRRVILLLLVVAVGGAGYWWYAHRQQSAATQHAGGRGDRMRESIPVLVATADKRDVPIYLEGLGTVQAFQAVTVRAQVDGTLVQVAFREGQDVRQGDVLAKIDPRTYQAALDQAIAKKQQDQANLANARLDLTRYQKLASTAYTSAQQADTQRAQVAQLEAQVAQDQAQIDTAHTQLSYTTITAPFDGRVGIRLVDQGNLIHASDTTGIVVLTQLKPISVVFTLPQQQLPQVTRALEAGEPEAIALPQSLLSRPDTDALDRGTLAVVDNQVDTTTGTIKLKATFPNQHLQLWPGAFVTVRLQVRTARDATLVPQAAVQRGPSGPYVWLVSDTMTAERRPVVVGHEDLSGSIIDSGIVPGDRVIVDGAGRLTDHAKITIVAPPGEKPPPGVPAPSSPDSPAPERHRRQPAVSSAS